MTKEDIIPSRTDVLSMAREAGLHRQQHNLASNPVQYRFSYDGYEENLERFAALVAAAEREAIAKRWEIQHGFDKFGLASAIRARSNA